MMDESQKKVVIELCDVKRDFLVGEETVHALRGVSFKIYEGEFVTIMGKSGSGKSTLNQLGCLDTPTSGDYFLDGVAVRTMSKSQRAVLRNRKIGFIFQNYNLLAKTTSVENVELPLMYNPSITPQERFDRSVAALKAVGLGERLYHKSNQMSGGQMQRVAIARALVNNPAVILADEATGNLDTRTSFEILVLFQKLHAEGRTIIFVTHNPDIAHYASRNIELRDGQLTNLQVVEVGTVDTRRRIVVAIDKLAGTLDEGGDGLDEMALVLEGLIVGELQGLHGGGVLSHTASHVGSRTDHDHIGSHLGDVALDAVLGALAHSEHRDHRRDADDDAQGGEEGPHLVGRNGAEGYF